jgi:beta-phosphoglucomutase-like phosphatase (HAD superfamily)
MPVRVVLDEIVETYRQLLEVGMEQLNPEILDRVLNSSSLFDIPDEKNSSEDVHLRAGFCRIEEHVKKIGLQPDDQRELEERIREVLRDTIDRLKHEEEEQRMHQARIALLPEEKLIRSYLADLAAVNDSTLIAGLAILVKDTDKYLAQKLASSSSSKEEHAMIGDQAKLFREVVDEVRAEDSKVAPDVSFAAVESDESLPSGIVAEASRGKADLNPLLEPEVAKPLTIGAGRRLFRRFKSKLRENICGPGGLHESIVKGSIAQAAVPTTIATTVLTTGLSSDKFWIPLAVYLSLLIVKSGLDTYCGNRSNDQLSSQKGKGITKRTTKPASKKGKGTTKLNTRSASKKGKGKTKRK